MATINATLNKGITPDDSVFVLKWTPLAASGDVGDAQSFAAYGDKTFIVTGTFTGTPTVVIEGCNDIVLGDWQPLSNRQGVSTPFTAAGVLTSQDKPAYVRPRLSAGTGGAAITITCALHRSDLAGSHF